MLTMCLESEGGVDHMTWMFSLDWAVVDSVPLNDHIGHADWLLTGDGKLHVDWLLIGDGELQDKQYIWLTQYA